ncbi:uncharacterized protein CDAR_262991 [Caerostris darwini]|uniref:Uncharacterized protein n=1 Tax=Caerostris darwini TaxID=1538125 RepID=A0AAV4RXH0_9ARAC|nr:uncharacterized protein CDAR_262991 [Caerostris darwini]
MILKARPYLKDRLIGWASGPNGENVITAFYFRDERGGLNIESEDLSIIANLYFASRAAVVKYMDLNASSPGAPLSSSKERVSLGSAVVHHQKGSPLLFFGAPSTSVICKRPYLSHPASKWEKNTYPMK